MYDLAVILIAVSIFMAYIGIPVAGAAFTFLSAIAHIISCKTCRTDIRRSIPPKTRLLISRFRKRPSTTER